MRSGEVQAWAGDHAIDAIVKCVQSPTEERPKTRWSVDTWLATLTTRLSAASESLSHRVLQKRKGSSAAETQQPRMPKKIHLPTQFSAEEAARMGRGGGLERCRTPAGV